MRSLVVWIALLALVACAQAGTPAPMPTAVPSVAPAAFGERLFVDKGCISCHANRRVTYSGTLFDHGPDLSSYAGTAEFLTLWLRDPAAVRPETSMPNLKLADAEIAALVAFLGQQ